jgi:PncC family amidohydrolase
MQEEPEIAIGNLLRQHGLKLATAESCTGGLLADHITDVPGSSDYFIGGVVAYAYEAKVALLHVSWDTLRARGAVSRETVVEMARGVRTALGADIGISISGIAGPSGGINRLAPRGSAFPPPTAIGRAGLSGTATDAPTRKTRRRPPCSSHWIT